jgi:putative ABC transport system permease protein
MEGAFNDVAIRLHGQTHPQSVIDRLDGLLAPYGGLGAYAREHQPSHRFLSEELRQLETSGTLFPAIFLGVAAFLLNVVVGRLVAHQREQIASLKAFGYGNAEIVLHYLALASLVVLAGVALGVAVGVWLGRGLAELYTEFFRFPFLRYRLSAAVLLQAGAVNLLAALLGATLAVRAAARLRPAEAMHPEPPGRYRPALAERLGLAARLSPAARMALRNVERRPVRSLLSVLGIALACGITMVAGFQEATVNRMLDVQFRLSRREDLAVAFVEPTGPRAARSLAAVEGVLRVEVFRAVPVRLRLEHRSFRTTLRGQAPAGDLERLLDTRLGRVELPPAGVALTDYLGELLGARPGDLVTVEVLEGHRPVRQVPVVSLVPEYLGVSAYMDLHALDRLLGEGPAISGAYLAVDESALERVYERLDEMPRVAGTVVREREIEGFHRTMDRTMLFFTFIASVFAVIIAFGVVYNIARIALTERSRDLGSLRVLGFTRAEVGRILLAELGLITVAGIPLGFGVGAGISAYFVLAFRSELYRLPLVIEPQTYAFAATVVVVAAAFSAWVVRRRLDRLDLVSLLKTRD